MNKWTNKHRSLTSSTLKVLMNTHLSWSPAFLLLMLWLRLWEKFEGSSFHDIRNKIRLRQDLRKEFERRQRRAFAHPHHCGKGFRSQTSVSPSQSALLDFGEIHPISKCFSLSSWTITFNGFCQTGTNILWFITSCVIIWEPCDINIREFWYLLPPRTEAWMQPWLLELQRCNTSLNVEVDEDEK